MGKKQENIKEPKTLSIRHGVPAFGLAVASAHRGSQAANPRSGSKIEFLVGCVDILVMDIFIAEFITKPAHEGSCRW